MIKARFLTDSDGRIYKVNLNGHADFVEDGIDPLCAAVTGIVTYAANTLTEVMGIEARISQAKEGDLTIEVPASGRDRAKDLLDGLQLQLEDYQAQYPKHISVHVQD